jgi:hypothetical protein
MINKKYKQFLLNKDKTGFRKNNKRIALLVLRNGSVYQSPLVGGFSHNRSWALTDFHYKKRKVRKKEFISPSF